MAKGEIIMNFKADGTLEMEGKDFKGADCDKHMKPYEQALGSVKKRTNKPEYNQKVKEGTKTQA